MVQKLKSISNVSAIKSLIIVTGVSFILDARLSLAADRDYASLVNQSMPQDTGYAYYHEVYRRGNIFVHRVDVRLPDSRQSDTQIACAQLSYNTEEQFCSNAEALDSVDRGETVQWIFFDERDLSFCNFSLSPSRC